MILSHDQPSAHVPRPTPRMSDRQRLLLLPASIAEPVECDFLRVKHRDVRWSRRFLEYGDVENALFLHPQRKLPDRQGCGLNHKCRCIESLCRSHDDGKVTRTLMNLGQPDIALQILGERDLDRCSRLVRLDRAHTECFQLCPQTTADLVRIFLPQ